MDSPSIIGVAFAIYRDSRLPLLNAKLDAIRVISDRRVGVSIPALSALIESYEGASALEGSRPGPWVPVIEGTIGITVQMIWMSKIRETFLRSGDRYFGA